MQDALGDRPDQERNQFLWVENPGVCGLSDFIHQHFYEVEMSAAR
jgi:hypothetical protein